MIKMVVFDMAGTTVNEDNVVYKTLHRAVNAAGFDISLDTVLLQGAGKEKKQAIADLLKNYNTEESLINEVYDLFVKMLDKAYLNLEVKPISGAIEIFDYLHSKGIKVVLNTGYNQATAESLLQKLAWEAGREFDALITASQVKIARPNPDMILLAQQLFAIDSCAEIMKVGDSIIDIEEGRNAGCGLCIAVTSGAHTYEQLQRAKPDYIFDTLLQIKSVL